MTISTSPKTSASLETLYTLVLVLTLAVGLAACGPKASDGDDVTAASSAPVKAETPEAETPEAEVVFEPAYPEEVSEEDLSETDTDQQKETHSHEGGATHSHGEEGGHSHG